MLGDTTATGYARVLLLMFIRRELAEERYRMFISVYILCLWSHCCMNNLYISHRSLYAPTYVQLLSNRQHAYQSFRVSSWFDAVCNIVTRWVNFRENHLHKHDLQLPEVF